jgi:hypothetical protein
MLGSTFIWEGKARTGPRETHDCSTVDVDGRRLPTSCPTRTPWAQDSTLLGRGRVRAEVQTGSPSDEIILQVYSPPDCMRETADLASYDGANDHTRRLRAGRTASYGSIRLFHKDVGFHQERISRPNSFSVGDHSRIKASDWKHGSTQRSPPV